MRRCASMITLGLAISTCLMGLFSPLVAQERDGGRKGTNWLDDWSFVIGGWDLTEKQYESDGALAQTHKGRARFTWAMERQRIEETQTIVRNQDERTDALQVFAHDPGSGEIEIVRTDSGHAGFWVIAGTATENGMALVEKYPQPESKVTRRITYTRTDDNHFARRLEFSKDRGESWFVRSEWIYTR